MDTLSLVIAIIGVVCTCLSITFAILTYAKSHTKDSNAIAIQLTKMETDIIYIRQSLDERKKWENNIEDRLRELETKKYSLV